MDVNCAAETILNFTFRFVKNRGTSKSKTRLTYSRREER
jgi:hypothetical protein